MSAASSITIAPVKIRMAETLKESERNLILQSWIRGHRRHCFGGQLDDASYNSGQEWLIRSLLERCATTFACYEDDADYILGWAVTSKDAVHYCWVRHPFRRKGIAKLLLHPYLERATTYTHPISVGPDWMAGKTDKIPKLWCYNPFHAFRIAAYPRPRDA